MEHQLVSPAAETREKEDMLGKISHGMTVYDQAGKLVGHVDGVYGGSRGEPAPAAANIVATPAPAASAGQQSVPIIQPVAAPATMPGFDDALDADEGLPRELRERLEHDGYIRIDAGLLKHHRFALRDQIERVAEGVVVLNVLAA